MPKAKSVFKTKYAKRVYEATAAKNPNEKEFLQAVLEVLTTLEPMIEKRPDLEEQGILERIVEPERMIMFRVPWVDDKGKVQVNRGYRIQFNSAIGPYKGGLRFHPSVKPFCYQVPRIRADLQEQPYQPSHGRRQGWIGFRSKGQV